jgi:hypothetical protein
MIFNPFVIASNQVIIFLFKERIWRVRIWISELILLRRKRRNVLRIVETVRLNAIRLFVCIVVNGIVALLSLVLLKIMVVDLVGQRLQLKPDFTDLSEKRWLDFVSMIGNGSDLVFGLFELFIILSVLVKLIIGSFFCSVLLKAIASLVFFITRRWKWPS